MRSRGLSYLVLVTALAAGCTSRYPVIVLGDSADVSRAGILAKIPAGTAMARARAVMEANGFTCREMKNADFLDRRGIDYLYCDREKAAGFMVGRRWQVALVDEAGRVKDVIVGTGLIGP